MNFKGLALDMYKIPDFSTGGPSSSYEIFIFQVTVGSPARLSLKRRQGYLAGFQRSCVKVDVDAGCKKPLNWKFF